MPRTLAAELTESLDVVECHGRLAKAFVPDVDRRHIGEMQHCIEQHGSVTVGQNKAVTIGPDRLVRIKAQKVLP